MKGRYCRLASRSLTVVRKLFWSACDWGKNADEAAYDPQVRVLDASPPCVRRGDEANLLGCDRARSCRPAFCCLELEVIG